MQENSLSTNEKKSGGCPSPGHFMLWPSGTGRQRDCRSNSRRRTGGAALMLAAGVVMFVLGAFCASATLAQSDATLSALSLGAAVPLAPSFASDTTDYRAWVANSVSSVFVTAAQNDRMATVEISDDIATTPNTAKLSLSPGLNTITVTVTSEDSLTTRTYTVALVREAGRPATDPDALLTANLTVGDTSGLPGFYGLTTTGRGAITDDDFTLDGTTYTLGALVVLGDAGLSQFNANTVAACFDGTGPPEAGRDNLFLSIGSDSFAFKEATAVTAADCPRVGAPGGAKLGIRRRRPDQYPQGAGGEWGDGERHLPGADL